MGILEQLEAGLRAGLGIPEARTGIPRLEVDEEVEVEDTFEGLLRTVGVSSLLSGGSTGETDLQMQNSELGLWMRVDPRWDSANPFNYTFTVGKPLSCITRDERKQRPIMQSG